MKRLLSLLIVVAMLSVSAVLMIPTSAATTAETKTYTPNWLEHKNNQMFEAFKAASGNYFDLASFWNYYSVTREENLLSATLSSKVTGDTNAPESTYLSKVRFDITETTKYEYTVKAKSNVTSVNSNNFGGVPFAISPDNLAYTAYGNFNNTNAFASAPSNTQSFIITIHGAYESRDPYVGDEYMGDDKYFEKLELDSEGFASLKIVYEGLDVTVYAKNTAGTFVQMGETVTLVEGSQVAFGLYSRNSNTSHNRTASIKDAKITALNEESVEYMEKGEEGFKNNNGGEDDRDLSVLEELLAQVEELDEADYTEDSWSYLMSAVNQAEYMLDDITYTQYDIDIAADDLLYAIETLEPLGDESDAPEESQTESESKETEPEPESESKETEPEPETDSKEEEPEEDVEDESKEESETETKKPSKTDKEDKDDEKSEDDDKESKEEKKDGEEDGTEVKASSGCGGAIATTVVAMGIVSALGAALVLKKKN